MKLIECVVQSNVFTVSGELFSTTKRHQKHSFCWLVPRSRPYKDWLMQSFSGIHLLRVDITIIVNNGSLKPIKNCGVPTNYLISCSGRLRNSMSN